MHKDPPEPGSWGLSRRTFVQGSLCSLALLALPRLTRAEKAEKCNGASAGFIDPHPAMYFQALPGNKVKCLLCPKACESRGR